MSKTLKSVRGSKVNIDWGHGKATFMAGGRKRVLVDEEYDGKGAVFVNGVVRFANGQEAYAVLEIDECSSGEHCGTAIFIPSDDYPCDITWQDDPDFVHRLGLSAADIYPYKYKLAGPTKTLSDHHIGDDGWSL